MGLLALGVGVGLGIAAYRNLPGVPAPVWGVVIFVWCLSMLAAYIGGRRFAQSQFQLQMQAQEQAQAQDQKQAQQVVVNVGVEGFEVADRESGEILEKRSWPEVGRAGQGDPLAGPGRLPSPDAVRPVLGAKVFDLAADNRSERVENSVDSWFPPVEVDDDRR